MSTSQASVVRATEIRHTASLFCHALHSTSLSELIKIYFNPKNPRITEHGPDWARDRLPFLSKTFSGISGCEEYFELLSQTLSMNVGDDTFPPPGSAGYVVDASAVANEGEKPGVVSVVGKASFSSIKTGKSWEEQFIYRFSDFDDYGRIGHWEIWADPLSAWVAVGEGSL